jgi:2-deoxy-D-gluconate 3-dehydrogenase
VTGHADLAALLDLGGRTALVTGGAMGIGRAVAVRLAQAGADVVVADADGVAADQVATELADQGHTALAVQVDVSSQAQVEHLVERTTAWRPGIDILVNDAGIFPTVPVLDMDIEQFRRVIDVNLTGVYLCSSLVARQMVAQGHGGRIINITSVDALHPSSVGLAHYDASKHGVWGFTKNLALELAPHRIWVNAIAPGGVHTPGTTAMTSVPGIDPLEIAARFEARIPMGRMGEPDEIAKVALFLASDMASYMTGSQVVVDGGVLLA